MGNDPITIKMHPHPDQGPECTAKPGGWQVRPERPRCRWDCAIWLAMIAVCHFCMQDEMKHKRHSKPPVVLRKPIAIPGLPGIAVRPAPNPRTHSTPGQRAVHQVTLTQHINETHRIEPTWSAHTLRTQIVASRSSQQRTLRSKIIVAKRKPKWM